MPTFMLVSAPTSETATTPEEERKIDASRWIKTKDKPVEEDQEDLNKEKKGEKKKEPKKKIIRKNQTLTLCIKTL